MTKSVARAWLAGLLIAVAHAAAAVAPVIQSFAEHACGASQEQRSCCCGVEAACGCIAPLELPDQPEMALPDAPPSLALPPAPGQPPLESPAIAAATVDAWLDLCIRPPPPDEHPSRAPPSA